MSTGELATGNNEFDVNAWLEDLQAPLRPYDGETTPPVTALDRVTLEVIERSGDDNDILKPDPYGKFSRPAMWPGEYHTGSHGERMLFGQDFLTRHESLRQDGESQVIYIYNKQHGGGRVIVDDFEGGIYGLRGLAARTYFSCLEDNPETIYKRRQTDFVSFIGNCAVNSVDFNRELTAEEAEVLTSVLVRPELLIAAEDELSTGEHELRDNFYMVVGENPEEAELRKKSFEDAQRTIKKHWALVEEREARRFRFQDPTIM